MVPCECGKPFDELTKWRMHSTMTGHCCIYKCRKSTSAASIPSFAFETATSSISVTDHTPAWNAPALSGILSREDYNLPYNAWAPAASRFHPGQKYYLFYNPHMAPLLSNPTKSCYPMLGFWNAPVASTLRPPKACSPLPDTWRGQN